MIPRSGSGSINFGKDGNSDCYSARSITRSKKNNLLQKNDVYFFRAKKPAISPNKQQLLVKVGTVKVCEHNSGSNINFMRKYGIVMPNKNKKEAMQDE